MVHALHPSSDHPASQQPRKTAFKRWIALAVALLAFLLNTGCVTGAYAPGYVLIDAATFVARHVPADPRPAPPNKPTIAETRDPSHPAPRLAKAH